MIQIAVILGLVLACFAASAASFQAGKVAGKSAEIAVCNTDKIEAANKALTAKLDAETTARQDAERRASDREVEVELQRAASNKLEADNAALRAGATDSGDVVFAIGDNWLLRRRSGTGGAAAGRR